MELEVPLIRALDSQRLHQVVVIRQVAHRLLWQSGDVTAERTHHGIGRRLTQVQNLHKAFGAQTVATLEHLRPAAAQVVQAVADLTLQLL